LTEEINGSAFVDCPLIEIRVAAQNANFKIEGNLLVTFDGTEVVRCFGLDREVLVGKKVKVLGISCFEGCRHLDRINFELGSELERIDRDALRDCLSLSKIEIPSSITIIDAGSFEGCCDLESCLFDEGSSLAAIGPMAFAKCISLRSFGIPGLVDEIGRNCFKKCVHLYRLKFRSLESLKNLLGDRRLDDALDEFGVSVNSSLFRIDVEDGRLGLEFPGRSSVGGGEGSLELSLVRDFE
jgi:hypothetical protein